MHGVLLFGLSTRPGAHGIGTQPAIVRREFLGCRLHGCGAADATVDFLPLWSDVFRLPFIVHGCQGSITCLPLTSVVVPKYAAALLCREAPLAKWHLLPNGAACRAAFHHLPILAAQLTARASTAHGTYRHLLLIGTCQHCCSAPASTAAGAYPAEKGRAHLFSGS